MQRKEYVVKIEPAGERRMRQIISTGSVDRAGDRIPVSAWDLAPFKQNPVIVWAHDYDVPAIATATSIEAVGDRLISTAQFPPPGIHPLADTIHGLLEAGILHPAGRIRGLPARSADSQ
jgi:Escherichia/Staphylococcus phage prohead protease